MAVFVKRLAANELGHTGGHQRGGILIPKGCVSFFPPLSGGANPEVAVSIWFGSAPCEVRLVYYIQGTRDEYRLTPVPHEVLRSATAGDFFVLEESGDGRLSASLVRGTDPRHAELKRVLGREAGRVMRFLPIP
jgi:hypothetical protein